MRWEYEPERFDIDGLPYDPTFRLTCDDQHKSSYFIGNYAEVKPVGGDFSKTSRLAKYLANTPYEKRRDGQNYTCSHVLCLSGEPTHLPLLTANGCDFIFNPAKNRFWYANGDDEGDYYPEDKALVMRAACAANNYRFDRRG